MQIYQLQRFKISMCLEPIEVYGMIVLLNSTLDSIIKEKTLGSTRVKDEYATVLEQRVSKLLEFVVGGYFGKIGIIYRIIYIIDG